MEHNCKKYYFILGDSFWLFLYQILCKRFSLHFSSPYFFETIGRF